MVTILDNLKCRETQKPDKSCFLTFFLPWLSVWLLVGWGPGLSVIGLRRKSNALILESNKSDKLDLTLLGSGGRTRENLAGEWRMCMREGVDLNPSDWTEVWDFTDRLLHTLEAEEGLVLDVKGTIGSINESLISCVWTSLPSWVSFSLVSPPWILFFVGECRDNILCGVDRNPSDHRDIELRLDIRSGTWELIFLFLGEFFING